MKTTSNTFTLKRMVLAAALAGALPLAALAQPAPGGDGPGMGPGMGMHQHRGEGRPDGMRGGMGMGEGMHGHGAGFLRGLDLTDAQKDKIFAIHYAQMPQMRDKFKIVRKSHEDLRALTTSPQYDDAKAKALADAGARAMADIALLKARSEHDIYALLTPEQKAQAEKNRQNFRHGPMSFGERGGRGMQGAPGSAPK